MEFLETLNKHEDFSVKGNLVRYAPKSALTESIDHGAKTVISTISTEAQDRHGDIMDIKGCQYERYQKNPVVLWSHDYDLLPVAKCSKIRVDHASKSVTAVAKFHLDTELSREVWALIKAGVLNAWSIGFIPNEYEPIEGKDGGFNIKKWDLLEYSSVPVPSNFEALTHSLKEGRQSAPEIFKAFSKIGFKAPELVNVPVLEITKAQAKESGGKNEEESMTLTEFLASNAEAKNAYDSAISKARNEARAELDAVIAKVKPVFESDDYNEVVKEAAFDVVAGELDIKGFNAIVKMVDAVNEQKKSKDAAEDSDETDGATPEDTTEESKPEASKGLISSEEELEAEAKRMRGGE